MAEFAIVKNSKNKYEIRKTWNNLHNPADPNVRWWGKRGYWVDDYERSEMDNEDGGNYGSKKYWFKWQAMKDFKKAINPPKEEKLKVVHTVLIPDPPAAIPLGINLNAVANEVEW